MSVNNEFSAVREAERIVTEYLRKRDAEKKRKRLAILFALFAVVSAVFFFIFLKF